VLLGAGVLLTIVLAIVTKFGLVGFAVMLAGAALTLAGQVAPARTARGAAVLGRVAGLQAYLSNESSADLPQSHRLEFASRCLPYAAVLGLTEKWALEIAATDDDDDPDAGIGWYSGPENWHLSDIGESLSNFVTAFGGTLSHARRLF
jgi:Kef-type K+ transport system membrane component KefB